MIFYRVFTARLCLIGLLFLIGSSLVHAESQPTVQELLQAGDNYFEAKKYDNAVEMYTQAIEADPTSPVAYEKRGLVYYFMLNDPDNAFADMSTAIELGSTAPGIYLLHGEMCIAREKDLTAISDFTKSIEYKPTVADPYKFRGMLYARKGKPDLAVADLTKAIELNTDDPYNTYVDRSRAYIALGRLDPAVADASKAIQLKPQELQAYMYRASAYYLAGQAQLAVNDYNYALRLKPDRPNTYYLLSLALEDMDAIDDAIEAINNYLNRASSVDQFLESGKNRLRYLQDLKITLSTAPRAIPKLPPGITAADGTTVSSAERQAIIIGVTLTDAFNSKSLDKLRAINVATRYVSDDQLTNALEKSTGWILRSVEVFSFTGIRMKVRMFYTSEKLYPDLTGETLSTAIIIDTLYYLDGRWRVFRESREIGIDNVSALQVMEKARKRYGVDDLSKWPGLSLK
jgi:tetratricopeptide (TPR) repeat protein